MLVCLSVCDTVCITSLLISCLHTSCHHDCFRCLRQQIYSLQVSTTVCFARLSLSSVISPASLPSPLLLLSDSDCTRVVRGAVMSSCHDVEGRNMLCGDAVSHVLWCPKCCMLQVDSRSVMPVDDRSDREQHGNHSLLNPADNTPNLHHLTRPPPHLSLPSSFGVPSVRHIRMSVIAAGDQNIPRQSQCAQCGFVM